MVLTFGNCQQVTLGSFSPEGDTIYSKEKEKENCPSREASIQTYDHIVAERKRREQISQRFVALSALVPGLKKMDKNSVLGDAINYLKHLQERVQTLEEQAANQRRESSMGCTDEQILPEIEAKVCNKNILLRIHCKNHRGLLVKILSEIEKRNLSVVNTNVAPFGSLALDISIIAEMDKEFNLTMQELVRRLRSALRQVQQSD
ncbi:unnamed protein product [Coffea canephora]|uniref:BHLH domain-containing protein n=1 Tax=Coffea canephora TaxID=49390 RepID=A0A068V9L9_COFCA|nr:unnamed protein product [Coffea canephora]